MPPNNEQQEWLQKWLNSVNDALDGTVHPNNADPEVEVPLWEAYVRGYVACHFHFRVYIRGKGHSHDLCADFQALRVARIP